MLSYPILHQTHTALLGLDIASYLLLPVFIRRLGARQPADSSAAQLAHWRKPEALAMSCYGIALLADLPVWSWRGYEHSFGQGILILFCAQLLAAGIIFRAVTARRATENRHG